MLQYKFQRMAHIVRESEEGYKKVKCHKPQIVSCVL